MIKRDYSDIINMTHHQSVKHPHMSMRDRAGQFAPFAALTGFDDDIKETAENAEKAALALEQNEEWYD